MTAVRPDPAAPLPEERAGAAEGGDAGRAIEIAEPAAALAESPYRNLWVPLIAVPAIIVGVIVLVFALFGQIAGSEAGLEQNLERMLHGGKNERAQAAFNLVNQVLANRTALAEGRAPEFSVEPGFQAQLRAAWSELAQDDNAYRPLAVAMLMSELGDPEAPAHLAELLALSPERDPQGELRFLTLRYAGALANPELAEPVIAQLDDADEGLRSMAAIALQRLDAPGTRPALRALLSEPGLVLRANAALSLSHLGDAAGAALLADLARPEIYAEARAADPAGVVFANPRDVRRARIEAVEALARLGRERELLEELARAEADLDVRAAALAAVGAGGE